MRRSRREWSSNLRIIVLSQGVFIRMWLGDGAFAWLFLPCIDFGEEKYPTHTSISITRKNPGVRKVQSMVDSFRPYWQVSSSGPRTRPSCGQVNEQWGQKRTSRTRSKCQSRGFQVLVPGIIHSHARPKSYDGPGAGFLVEGTVVGRFHPLLSNGEGFAR